MLMVVLYSEASYKAISRFCKGDRKCQTKRANFCLPLVVFAQKTIYCIYLMLMSHYTTTGGILRYRYTPKGGTRGMAYNSYWNENWEEPWQNLLYYMQLRNISFQQLAERSGVKQSTIEGWRRNKMMMLHAWGRV